MSLAFVLDFEILQGRDFYFSLYLTELECYFAVFYEQVAEGDKMDLTQCVGMGTALEGSYSMIAPSIGRWAIWRGEPGS